MIVGIACEDRGHFDAVTYLVDGALLREHDWLDGIIDSCRSWRGLDETERWYKYDRRDAHDLRPLVLEDGSRISRHGRIRGEVLEPEASMWRKVLMLFCHRTPRPELVLLVRDMDGYDDRKDGMLQVRDGISWPFGIVIAAPGPEIEAWYVAGFVPRDEQEHRALAQQRAALSFDPTLASHRLTSHPNDAAKDAKRVLEALCGSNVERRHRCLDDPGLLRERGVGNGAAAFLDEVQVEVLPRMGMPRK
ncbi:MAG: hypothetical protein AB1Z98_28875 [Nannocystaceae bacterium]